MAEENMPEFDFSGEFDDINNVEDIVAGVTEEELEQAQQPTPQPTSQVLPEDETTFFAWQVCLANEATSSLENADNFPNYIVNRDAIVQMLGVGMATGQNAFPVEGQMFVVAISMQVNGEIQLISPDFPRYKDIAAVISEQLLKGDDKGMVALLPNGNIVPIKLPGDIK